MKHGSHKLLLFIILFFYSFDSFSEPIAGYSVSLQILDKITSKIQTVEINTDDYYEYGTLKIEIYACYKRPPEDIPEDFVLMRIFDTLQKKHLESVFQGWMISSSPAATPFEHPIYDLWVKECKIDKVFEN